MFTDDLFSRISLDLLCPLVPVLNDSTDIKQDDNVVFYFRNHAVIPLFALAEKFILELQILIELLDPDLLVAAFREVTGDFRKTNDITLSVMDRRNGNTSPKTSSILPHAPAFVVCLSIYPGQVDQFFRHTRCLILRRVEHSKTFANCFMLRIALYFLSSAVPVFDDTILR